MNISIAHFLLGRGHQSTDNACNRLLWDPCVPRFPVFTDGEGELRNALCLFDGRIREKLAEEELDPTMAAALPPGAWWATRNGLAAPRTEAYGPHAGNAAVDAARLGDLQLADVDFSYPLRPEAPGEATLPPLATSWLHPSRCVR